MSTPSDDYISFICSLYNDVYDDRIEDTKPGGHLIIICNPGGNLDPNLRG